MHVAAHALEVRHVGSNIKKLGLLSFRMLRTVSLPVLT